MIVTLVSLASALCTGHLPAITLMRSSCSSESPPGSLSVTSNSVGTEPS